MMKTIIGLIAFGAGCATGYYAAKRMLEQKYEQLVLDEVEAVKKALRKYRDSETDDAEEEKTTEQAQKLEYTQRIHDLGYSEDTVSSDPLPYVITPEEFGSMDEYEQITLTFYSDLVLTDDDNRPMSDSEIEYAVGKESLNHFGEFEEDSVYVRNDRLKVDYEILLDEATYSEILQRHPYLRL